jgi:hypothetical protein
MGGYGRAGRFLVWRPAIPTSGGMRFRAGIGTPAIERIWLPRSK